MKRSSLHLPNEPAIDRNHYTSGSQRTLHDIRNSLKSGGGPGFDNDIVLPEISSKNGGGSLSIQELAVKQQSQLRGHSNSLGGGSLGFGRGSEPNIFHNAAAASMNLLNAQRTRSK